MESFSQRQGIKPIKSIVQIESMDNDLRNSLWNALTLCYWDGVKVDFVSYNLHLGNNNLEINNMSCLIERLWIDYFKLPLDTLSDYKTALHIFIRSFFLNCKWSEVYDFVEFVSNNYPAEELNIEFRELCNIYLEREVSAYRFIDNLISPITSELEINSIEDALQLQEPLQPVAAHIRSALNLLSDRESPNFRNSVKESISAVEAVCQLITSDSSATLGKALKKIENDICPFHPALKSAFEKLYGYTSDADGIRHALLEESRLGFEDAKFMLVVCSGFTNFLVSKFIKTGNKL